MPCMDVIHQTLYRAFCMFSDIQSGHLSDSGQNELLKSC